MVIVTVTSLAVSPENDCDEPAAISTASCAESPTVITTVPTTVDVELLADAVHVTAPVAKEHTTLTCTDGLKASHVSEKVALSVAVPSRYSDVMVIVTVTPVVVVPEKF